MNRRTFVLALVMFAIAACDGGGSASPSTTTTSPPSPSPGCPPTTSNAIRAVSLSFDRDCMAVPAGVATSLAFTNDDAAESHNVALYPADSCLAKAVTAHREPRCQDPTGPAVYRGAVIVGVATTTYAVPPLPHGDYVFVCEVHPYMHGVFRVR